MDGSIDLNTSIVGGEFDRIVDEITDDGIDHIEICFDHDIIGDGID